MNRISAVIEEIPHSFLVPFCHVSQLGRVLSPGPAGRLSGLCPSGAQESSGFCRNLPSGTAL